MTLGHAASALPWPVFACNADKKPIVPTGFKAATRDNAIIMAQFDRPNAAMIGVPTGRASGLIVIDVDIKEGRDGRAWLAENCDALPFTLTHKTRSGGLHLLFQMPEGIEIRNSTSRVAPGVDVRGEGGYVIVPPSPGYAVADPAPPAEMPRWLIRACMPTQQEAPPSRPTQTHERYVQAAIDGEILSVVRASEGTRNDTLNKAAFKLGTLVGAGVLVRATAEAELQHAGQMAGLPAREAATTIKSGIDAGMANPRVIEEREHLNGHSAPDTGRYKAVQSDDCTPDSIEENPQPPKRGTPYGRLNVLGMGDIDTAPIRSYLLKGLISPAEVSVWVGPPKCGKSFLLLYVAYMLSLGRSVFGRRVKATKVLYVAAEGEAGIGKRIRALRDRHGISDNFYFIAQPIDLLRDSGHKREVIDAAEAVGAQLIVVDTLNRALAGGDENSPQDMGLFIRNISEIKHRTSAHIAIIHHGTKSSDGRSPRGHGSLEGADDALVEVVKQPDGKRVATLVHAKDDADGMTWGFDLDLVEMGVDEDGDPITTLIVQEHTTAPKSKGDPLPHLSNNEQIALLIFDKAMKAESMMATVGDNHEERPVLPITVWRRWFYAEGKPGETANTKRTYFNRALDGLQVKGRIAVENEYIWRVDTW